MNKNEKNTARINVIETANWMKHYRKLWVQENESDINNEIIEIHDVDWITYEELEEALENAKNRKATGSDRINTELLKYGGTVLHLRLLHLINRCWQTSTIPETWKTAEVVSLFKIGDHKDCRNYREISLLNSINKTYAKIVNKRLRIILEVLGRVTF